MPPADTRSASSDDLAWVVPESLRPALAQRYGPVYSGPEVEARVLALTTFASCGDMVTALAVRIGHLPIVGLVDLKTQRNDPISPTMFAPLAARRHVKVRNPPGTLTQRLRTAVRDLIGSGGGLIEVDGEEDLGALALVESMPLGATVIYGIPGAGVSFVTVDAVAQEHVRQLIDRMEPRRLDLGP